jgi:hypothetical protein
VQITGELHVVVADAANRGGGKRTDAGQHVRIRGGGLMPADAPTILACSMGFDHSGRYPVDWRPGPVFSPRRSALPATRPGRGCAS